VRGEVWKIMGDDLEGGEEQVGALEVDLVGGDAADEFAEGALDVGVAGGRGMVKFLRAVRRARRSCGLRTTARVGWW
jgi:hypothetical protein